jgi:uncharacterized membrane protein
MKKKRNGLLSPPEKIALAVIGIFHLAGLVLLSFSSGFIYSISLDFVPINLILTTLLLVKFQKEYSSRFWVFFIFSFLAGYLAEVIGVNTGLIFGHYSYGEVLGPGLFGTPFLIGLNWFMLAYSAICLCDFLPAPSWIRFFTAVTIMVGLDYLIEPVAMRLGFWNWELGTVPLQNYLGWTAVAAIILGQAFLFQFARKNRVAALTFLIQVLFFLLQSLL